MGTHKVLVIDEEKSSAAVFGKALEPRGIDVYVMDTPDKGIEKAIEIEPDLIFVNLIFQESNGLKVSKLIHAVEKLRKIPIIMLLSHKSDLDPKYTTTIGVVDILTRPFAPEVILAKTLAALGLPASAESSRGQTAASPAASGFDAGLTPGQDAWLDSEYEQDFADEADKLIDQSIISPRKGSKNLFDDEDDQPKEDVIHLRRAEVPKAAAGDHAPAARIAADKLAKETAMEERNLFDEEADRKKDAIHRSFEDEFEESEKDEMLRHEPSEDADFSQDVFPEEKKSGTGKKVLLAVGGVVLIAGLGLGAYVAKKTFFRGDTVKVVPQAPKKEVVNENLPPAGAVNAPDKPATLPDVKALPPAAVTAKTEPVAPAVPAPAATPAPAVRQEQANAKAAPAKPAEQKPVAAPAAKPVAGAKKEKAASIFALQAGAFESEKNAAALVEKLKAKGYEAYSVKGEVSGKGKTARTIHRVLIGKFDTGKKAAAYARELKQKDNLSVVIYHQ